jgi:hypothetical protein
MAYFDSGVPGILFFLLHQWLLTAPVSTPSPSFSPYVSIGAFHEELHDLAAGV